MANREHLEFLKKGVEIWNNWRDRKQNVIPDLKGVDLSDLNLSFINLRKTMLSNANLNKTKLIGADLEGASLINTDLVGADLSEAKINKAIGHANFRNAILYKAQIHNSLLSQSDFYCSNLEKASIFNSYVSRANFSYANLRYAKLTYSTLMESNFEKADLENSEIERATLCFSKFQGSNLFNANFKHSDLLMSDLTGSNLKNADFQGANLHKAILKGSDLSGAILALTNLTEADLSHTVLNNCAIYGASVWDVNLRGAKQNDLYIMKDNKRIISVDNLEVAQFIFLLINNEKIREVIDTVTSKVVLILGRFIKKRKEVLEAIKREIRKSNYLPIIFDFQGPSSRDITETIMILANMARFVIADITDARSISQELQATVPNLPSVPIQPLLEYGKDEYGMFEHFKNYPWILPIHSYKDIKDLMSTFDEKVIKPVEKKVIEIRRKK